MQQVIHLLLSALSYSNVLIVPSQSGWINNNTFYCEMKKVVDIAHETVPFGKLI